MKKFLVIALAIVCTAALVPQNLSAAVGIKGGFNFANITVKPTSSDLPVFDNLTGLTGGVYFCLNIGFIGIEPEILYSRRGVQWNSDTTNIKYELDYVEVPLLLKVNILRTGIVRPVIFAGPSFGYLWRANGKLTSPDLTDSADIRDQFKKTEWAAVFGAGFDFKLPVITLSVDARYHLGITDINAMIDTTETIKNKGFTIMVGIGF